MNECTTLDRTINQAALAQTANVNDAVLRYRAYQVRDIGLCAFLVALAAWQRGLKVTFHYEVVTKCQRFANAAVQGYRGELFSVSDGHTAHFFRRTLGDLTSREISQLCENKQATKQRLIENGIEVPAGVVVQQGDTDAVMTFLQRYPGRHFILKPLDGTRGQGVYRNVPPSRVLPTLGAAAKRPHLLEEYVPGPQYRVIVVGGRYVASWDNRLPLVTGDGINDIATLMAQARERSHQLTHPSLVSDDLTLKPDVVDYLARQGLTPGSVPMAGQTVILWPEPDADYGSEVVDCTQRLPEPVRRVAIKAAEALALPVAGLDLIVEQVTERIVVLEANQMPMIRAMTFPHDGQGQGNRVAEAIIGLYFPDSADNPRHTQASFDFVKICETLQSGMVGEVTLPVLGPGWVHKRFQVAAASRDDKTLPTIRHAMFTYGIHAQLVNSDKGDLIVDVVAPEALYAAFVRALKGKGAS